MKNNDMDILDLNGFICVLIEITRRCNMRCSYCYVTPRAHSEPELSIDEQYEIIHHIKGALAGKSVVFHFAGGEVFVKKGVIDLLRRLLEEKTPISLVSNGLEVPEDIFTNKCFKKETGLFNFQMSMDGLQKGHQVMRLDFERVLANFRRLTENGVWTIVRTTLHRGNIGEIIDFHEFMNRLGVEYDKVIEIDVQPVAEYPQGQIENFKSMNLTIEEYLSVGFMVDELVKTSLPRIKSSWRFVHDVAPLLKEKDRISSNSACFGCGGGFGFAVCANGDVMNCEMDVPFTNIRENICRRSINTVIETLREKNRPRKRCLHCHLNTICGMCRLAPFIHGYTYGFGYSDCVPFMERVRRIHSEAKETALAAAEISAS
jgi:radical SAM protein with 4Fe4S-binding SPASM domain